MSDKETSFDYFFLLSYGFLKLGEIKPCYKFLKKCKKIDPLNVKGYILAAKYYILKGEFIDAKNELKQLLAFQPNNSKALKLLKKAKETDLVESDKFENDDNKENELRLTEKRDTKVKASIDRGMISYNINQRISFNKVYMQN